MKLKDCKYGILVVTENGEIGMIKGITNNCQSGDISVRRDPLRAIPLVEWSKGETCEIHPGNIEILK